MRGRNESGSKALGNGWRPGTGSSFSGDPLNLSPGAQMEGICAFGQGQIEWTEQRTGAGLRRGSKILTNADSTGTFSRHPGGNRKARKRVSSSRSLSKNPLPPSLCLYSGSIQVANSRELRPGDTKRVCVWPCWTWSPSAGAKASTAEKQSPADYTTALPPLPMQATVSTPALREGRQSPNRAAQFLAKVTVSTSQVFPEDRDDGSFSKLPLVIESDVGRSLTPLSLPTTIRNIEGCANQGDAQQRQQTQVECLPQVMSWELPGSSPIYLPPTRANYTAA